MAAVPLRHEAKPRQRVRTAKHATAQRVSRKQRERYRTLLQFSAGLVFAVIGFMLYLDLNANLTRLNYAYVKAERERASLQGQTARLDEQLAALRSDDRLAAIAAQLHMQDGQQFAIVAMPVPAAPARRTHVALLS